MSSPIVCACPALVRSTVLETKSTNEINRVVKPLSEPERANQLFDEIFMQGVMRSPMYQTYLAIKKDYEKWDDISDSYAEESLAITKQNLSRVNEGDVSLLVNQAFSLHSTVPSL